jgi:hypothetical protein
MIVNEFLMPLLAKPTGLRQADSCLLIPLRVCTLTP